MLAESVILVSQPFNGDGANNLNGSPPPVYHADLAASGGSGVWTGHSLFKQDGSNMNFGGGQSSIALDLGTYLDDQKGKEDALFILQCTIRLEQVGGTQGSKFLTMGFSESDGVNPDQNFTHSDNESLAAVWNQNEPRGPVVRWHGAGANALGSIAGPTVQTRTYTTTIDLRDHNGIDNFGTVHFEVSGLGHLGTWTLAEDHSFRSILLSANDRAPGTFSNLILAKPGPRGSIEATLSHDAMVMRVGFPALIPTGAAYPTLEITSDYEAEGGYELEVIRESDGQVVDSFSGTLQHGESVTLLENTPASEPGTYRLQLKYIQGDRVMYEAFYFTVGLEQLREHLSGFSNFSEIVFPGPDGQMIYIPDFRGNHIPDFSRVG
ncbi:MAG: hypothetical protein JJU05_18075, partial [Verrucomicrobia bacterium]|nr:hypothetical protein [Verrucomicrobiota bacterium]